MHQFEFFEVKRRKNASKTRERHTNKSLIKTSQYASLRAIPHEE